MWFIDRVGDVKGVLSYPLVLWLRGDVAVVLSATRVQGLFGECEVGSRTESDAVY